jgi:hypothetical protein
MIRHLREVDALNQIGLGWLGCSEQPSSTALADKHNPQWLGPLGET